MRASAILFMSLAMAVGAVCLAFAAPGTSRPGSMIELDNVSGAVTIANTRDSQALFSASAMRPGDAVSGTVTIGNSGDVNGVFDVRVAGVVDTPGPNGGLLSERVELVLFDVTDIANPETVFAGHPADLDAVDLGTFAPGEERDYRFSATLPDDGAGDDNLYQGAGLSLGFEWRAATTGTSTPTPTPTATQPKPKPKPKPKPTVTPTPTPVPVDMATVLGLPPSTKCFKRGKLKFKLKAPAGTKVRSAKVAVNGKTKLRLKGKKVRKAVTLKRLRKIATVTVTAKVTGGRTYVGTRAYVSCKR
jgi:spore coat-associated protein N